jgi:hypothetical protein
MNVNQPLLNSMKVPSFPLPSFYSKKLAISVLGICSMEKHITQDENIFLTRNFGKSF